MATSAFDKFKLLLWKNWIIQLRHPFQTFFEFAVPIFVCMLPVIIRVLNEPKTFSSDLKFQPQNISTISFEHRNKVLAYFPNNSVLESLVTRVAHEFDFSVNSELDAKSLEQNARNSNTFASIEFDESYKDLTKLPDSITYALRFPAELRTKKCETRLMSTKLSCDWETNVKFSNDKYNVGPRNKYDSDGGVPTGYLSQGFIAIQNALDRQIILQSTRLTPGDLPPLVIQRFPFPHYTEDILGSVLDFMFPYVCLIAFVYNCINIIKYVSLEKELQLKEAMKIMGLPSYLHWVAWYTKCMLFQLVIITILTAMFKTKFANRGDLAIFTHIDWTILWLFLFVYVNAMVTYSFMVTTFFNRSNLASIVGAILWFILLIPFHMLRNNYDEIELYMKLGMSLIFNSGMGFGFKVLIQYETAGVGVQWSNLFTPLTADDDLTLGAIMIVLLVASALQMTIAIVTEKIKLGEFNLTDKFDYKSSKYGKYSTEHDIKHLENFDFEAEPIGKYAGIKVRSLKKVFDGRVAVNNLSLNMYEDQITVLLGHNGAGKSTTMSMLTGLIKPTSGTAFIAGKDIRTDLDSARNSLGLCPQHNVLFNELTVKEHITFFSKLKGLKTQREIDGQIIKYVNLLELTPKLNAESHTLSGGMKRKLSIGIALCGDSKIVMCDEPTTGMDPAARRALWNVLIQERKGRTILLTTHFMDEADVLGDRIAIMAEGELKTIGSSFFLKKKYGVGYRLVCVKKPSCDPIELTKVLATHIPEIQVETNVGSELSYILHENYSCQFRTIFSELETQSDRLGISSFGVVQSTLEEVFLKVGSDANVSLCASADVESTDDLESTNDEMFFDGSAVQLLIDETNLLHGLRLYQSQVYAMALKKVLFSLRSWKLFLIQFIIPAIFVVITMLIEHKFSGDKNLPALPISLDQYLSTATVAATHSTSHSSTNGVFVSFQRIFKSLTRQHAFSTTKDDFETHILQQTLSSVNLKYMVGASFHDSHIVAWFNNQGFHTAPLSINLVNNAILQSLNSSVKSINVINKPLPFSPETKIGRLEGFNNLGFKLAFNTTFAMALTTAMFSIFYLKERVSRAKLLQFLSGVNKFIFWLTSFVIDYLLFITICLVYIVVLNAYDSESYKTYEELLRNFVLLAVFGFAVLPFTYLLSFLFQVPSTGFVKLALIYIVTGNFTFIAYFTLNIKNLGLQHIAKLLGRLAFAFPHYSLARGMSNLYMKHSELNSCKSRCDQLEICKPMGVHDFCENSASKQILPDADTSFYGHCHNTSRFYSFDEEGLGMSIISLVTVGVLSFIALFVIDYEIIKKIFGHIEGNRSQPQVQVADEDFIDSDVLAENKKVRSRDDSFPGSSNLVVKDFTKRYGKMVAVNQICVDIKKNECFGLLGINGAGKTSTFKMLTGDETISSGEAWVEGVSIKKDMNKVHQRIGYCPQFDALLEDLTGRETLKIFALLKGIKLHEIEKVSMDLANGFNLTKHLDKRVKSYSGGNKRKLSTALALIADPSVIYLDEPTSGMDVGARRQLWNMVIKARDSGKSVVLTSHSMEEIEVLCTRLTIMVNGEFKCLGSTQHLKNKFSKGYSLTIKLGQSDESLERKRLPVQYFIERNFPNASLKEEYMDILTYLIPVTEMKWSQMFGLMEEAKTRLGISDYSLGQTTLEQVFLYFTKYSSTICH